MRSSHRARTTVRSLSGPPLGGASRAGGRAGGLAGQGPYSPGQRRTPRQLASVPRDLVVRQRDRRLIERRAQGLADPEPHPVALAFPRSLRLEERLRAEILALRV